MRIAYIVEPRRVIGGGVRAAMNLALALKSYYDEEATVFGTARGTVEDKRLHFHEVDTFQPMGWKYWRAYHRFIKAYRPDLVHCLGLYTALLCIAYRLLLHRRYKIVVTVHRVTMNMRYRRLMGAVVGLIAKKADYTTFLTDYQKQHYFENVRFRPAKYVIVPNVIYVQQVDEKEVRDLRSKLKKQLDADFLTSYVGRIIPSKNLEDFIRIVALANQRGLNLGGVLVGGYSAEYYDRLQRVIQENDIASKIVFIGYVNTPTLYTAATDTTTTTTMHGEALPNLLVESYALGKLTFSSDIPQMTGLISHEVNGFTFPLTQLDLFVEKMKEVLSNDAMRKQMEEQARNTYRQTYEPKHVASVYYRTYKKVL